MQRSRRALLRAAGLSAAAQIDWGQEFSLQKILVLPGGMFGMGRNILFVSKSFR